MSKFLLTVCAFGLLLSSAFGQENPQKKQFTRVLASGKKDQIGFYTSLHPDCTSRGDIDIRVTTQPEHGTVDTAPATSFPTYPKEHVRFKCNEHKVKGVQLNYKSAEKYVGNDAVDLLVLFPNGFAWEVHYHIDVRAAEITRSSQPNGPDEQTIEKWKERDRQGEEKYNQWQKSTEKEQIAAGLQKFDFTRYVPSGKKRTIEFLYAANPDCSIMDGSLEVRKSKEPEHGTIEIVSGDYFPNFPISNARFKCNYDKIRGLLVNYTSAGGYTGTDTLDLLVLYPSGFAREIHINLNVR